MWAQIIPLAGGGGLDRGESGPAASLFKREDRCIHRVSTACRNHGKGLMDTAWGVRKASQSQEHLVRVLKNVKESNRWRNVGEIF